MHTRLLVHNVAALLALLMISAPATAITNGNFETGSISGGGPYTAISSPSTIGPWTVINSVDYFFSGGYAQSGNRMVELNSGVGSAAGSGIQQEISTVYHGRYRIGFWMSGNPGNQSPGQIIKTMRVQVVGSAPQLYNYDVSGRSGNDWGWEYHYYEFQAAFTGSTSTLKVTTEMNGTVYGPAVDNLTIGPAPSEMLIAIDTPALITPGSTVNGMISCTNTGFGFAPDPLCIASAVDSNSNPVAVTMGSCTVLPSGNASPLVSNHRIECGFSYTVPGSPGGSSTLPASVTVTGHTDADNDEFDHNNNASVVVSIIDAVNDSISVPGGSVSVTANLAGNDDFPAGSNFALAAGSNCPGINLNTTNGMVSYNVPNAGSCNINYRVCAPSPDQGQCDNATLTVSAEPADMSAAISLSAAGAPGASLSGSITCTNNSGTATGATCSASAIDSASNPVALTVSNCSPATPATVAQGDMISCDIAYTLPGSVGGAGTGIAAVTVTAATSANNDNNSVNNSSVASTSLVDAVNDSDSQPGGSTGVTTSLAGNDGYPNGSHFSLVGGGTCANASVDASSGLATYDVPDTGSCELSYQICAPSPDQGQCDNATLSVTAGTADISASINLPVVQAPGATVQGTITCTNNSGTATGATCNASAFSDSGQPVALTVDNCLPPTPAILDENSSVSCDIHYIMPGSRGGSSVGSHAVNITVTASAANDENPDNNTAVAEIEIIDAVNDRLIVSGGSQGVTVNLADNDRYQNGSRFSLEPGGTCLNASVNPVSGVATLDVAERSACILVYQVCAPSPDENQCDYAEMTISLPNQIPVFSYSKRLLLSLAVVCLGLLVLSRQQGLSTRE
ncbi:MAG: DUF642 domain-containing protein [Parahaliea sp.]